jgi:ATP synthase protein I
VLSQDQRVVVSILGLQAALSLGLAGLAAIWLGQTVAISWLLGGAVAVIPNSFLAARLLAPGSATSADALYRAAWLGEIGKLLLTAVLFAAVFVSVRPISVPAVFGGYIAAQLVVFGVPLMGSAWFDGKDGKTKN